MKHPSQPLPARLTIEALEDRLALSLTSATLTSGTLLASGNDSASDVTITRSGSTTTIKDATNNFSMSFTGTVSVVQVVGGTGADRVVNKVGAVRLEAWGNGGNDYLEGNDGADKLVGGNGNDILLGRGGNDKLWGEDGNDTLLGGADDDELIGGNGNDHLNGGAHADKLWGGNGDDVLITVFGGFADKLQGDAGRDVMWLDRNGSKSDVVVDPTAEDKLQFVDAFANGADRTLNGERIADPKAKNGTVYKRFADNPLFSANGPSLDDIKQGSLGDCWLLAGLGAVALDNGFAIKANVVDFDDGTYGVRLGNKFYRVDDDLAVASSGSTTPFYAKLGAQGSLWVAIVEKAYAHYRSGANSYASLDGGWTTEVNKAFGSTAVGSKGIKSYSSATSMADDIYTRWLGGQAVTMGFDQVPSGVPLIESHAYTVFSLARNSAGQVTSITLRNPWGVDGAGNDGNNDGYVTLTPSQLYSCRGDLDWGRV